MLTHHDVTVKNAHEVFEQCKDIEEVKYWGFKNVGLPKDEMKALTRRYGGGAHKYCGALLGAVAAMNMASGQLNEDDPAVLDGKASDKAAELLRRFEAKNGSVFCRELKGRDTGVVLRPCRGCVEDAAELAEEIFEGK